MATGYTHDIAKGISFEQFVMGCARAFGACISMKEDSQSKEIPEKFEPSTWNVEKLVEANKRLSILIEMGIDKANQEALSAYQKNYEIYQEGVKKRNDLKTKYEGMLKKVWTWVPPTPDHVGLLSFMTEQLESSIKFDCYATEPPEKIDGALWLERELESAKRDVTYHTKENKEEIERANGRTKWIKDLRESLSK